MCLLKTKNGMILLFVGEGRYPAGRGVGNEDQLCGTLVRSGGIPRAASSRRHPALPAIGLEERVVEALARRAFPRFVGPK